MVFWRVVSLFNQKTKKKKYSAASLLDKAQATMTSHHEGRGSLFVRPAY